MSNQPNRSFEFILLLCWIWGSQNLHSIQHTKMPPSAICIEKHHNKGALTRDRETQRNNRRCFCLVRDTLHPHVPHRCYKTLSTQASRYFWYLMQWTRFIWVSLKSSFIFQAMYLKDKSSLTTQFHERQLSEDGFWGDIVLTDLCPCTSHRFLTSSPKLAYKAEPQVWENNCIYRCWVVWNKVVWF